MEVSENSLNNSDILTLNHKNEILSSLKSNNLIIEEDEKFNTEYIFEIDNETHSLNDSKYTDYPKDFNNLYDLLNSETENLKLISFSTNPQFPQYNCNPKLKYHQFISEINNYGTIHPLGKLVSTPNEIKIPLKIHQKRALYEMIKKENSKIRFVNNFNVNLYCDKAGSGKSLTILSLIASNPLCNFLPNLYYYDVDKTDSMSYQFNNENYIYGNSYKLTHGLKPSKSSYELNSNLVIVPHNIFNQWKKYILNQTNLSAFYIDSLKSIDKFTLSDPVNLCNEYKIILVKSTMYRNFVSSLQNILGKCRLKCSLNKYQESKLDLSIKTTEITQEKLNTLYKDLYSYLSTNDVYQDKINQFTEQIIELNEQLKENIVNTKWSKVINKKSIKNVEYIQYIKGFYFQRIIIDEVDSIKIPSFPYLYAKQIWYISSSINNLVYPKGYKSWNNISKTTILKSSGISGTGFLREVLVNMFSPQTNSLYGTNYSPAKLQYFRPFYTIIRNDNSFIKNSLQMYEPNYNYIQCLTPAYVYAIKSAINPEALKALNAGDNQMAIKLLGCEKNTEQEIIKSVTKNLEIKKKEYNKILLEKQDMLTSLIIELDNELDELSKKNIKNDISNIKISIKQYSKKLDDTENKLNGIHSRLSNVNDKKCPICSDNLTEPCMSPCCKNVFCFECLLSRSCFCVTVNSWID